MLTFSINPTLERVSEAGATVIKDKPVSRLTRFEQIGMSEGFIKTVSGNQKSRDLGIGAYGNAVLRNTKMTIQDREVSILPVEEVEAGCKGGVSEAVFVTKNFADNDKWLESMDTDFEVIQAVFELVETEIYNKKKKLLTSILGLALRGLPKNITKAVELIEEFNDLSNLLLISQEQLNVTVSNNPSKVQRVIIYVKEHTLKDLVGYVITNNKAGEVVGLY